MTITFYTNFINHHQVPLADCFFKLLRYQMNLESVDMKIIHIKNI